MKCPSCAAAVLVPDTRDVPYSYRGESTMIPCVSGEFCPACADSVLDTEESARVSAAMLDFAGRVNASIGEADFIAGVRRKLALDQREAAEIFGGGINAFARYETGRSKPPLALLKLFRLLDQHPELLEKIRTGGIQGNA